MEVLLEPKMGHLNCENVKNNNMDKPAVEWRIFCRILFRDLE